MQLLRRIVTYDSQQLKLIEDQMGLENCVVVDTFRIQKSPKYMGNGPCILDLTLLTSAMAIEVQDHWNKSKHLLPNEIRLQDGNFKYARNTETGCHVYLPVVQKTPHQRNIQHSRKCVVAESIKGVWI